MLRTVLVTGATGTVGSAVVSRLLQAGIQVRALVRSRDAQVPGAEAVPGDLGDPDALKRAARGTDALIHCAAALNDDAAACRRVNVEGTRNVVEAALASGARLVHVSTVSVYSNRARAAEVGEDHPLRTGPPDDYGRSKAEAERLVQAGAGRGLVAAVLRPTVVLSMHPRSYWGPLALERARTSPEPVMHLAQVPHVHVTNLAEALWLAATRAEAAGRSYNVVDGHAPAQEYLEAVYGAIGRPVPGLPGSAPRIRYSGERLRRELGYTPRPLWRAFLDELKSVAPR